jgi:hypothetical protein
MSPFHKKKLGHSKKLLFTIRNPYFEETGNRLPQRFVGVLVVKQFRKLRYVFLMTLSQVQFNPSTRHQLLHFYIPTQQASVVVCFVRAGRARPWKTIFQIFCLSHQ